MSQRPSPKSFPVLAAVGVAISHPKMTGQVTRHCYSSASPAFRPVPAVYEHELHPTGLVLLHELPAAAGDRDYRRPFGPDGDTHRGLGQRSIRCPLIGMERHVRVAPVKSEVGLHHPDASTRSEATDITAAEAVSPRPRSGPSEPK